MLIDRYISSSNSTTIIMIAFPIVINHHNYYYHLYPHHLHYNHFTSLLSSGIWYRVESYREEDPRRDRTQEMLRCFPECHRRTAHLSGNNVSAGTESVMMILKMMNDDG